MERPQKLIDTVPKVAVKIDKKILNELKRSTLEKNSSKLVTDTQIKEMLLQWEIQFLVKTTSLCLTLVHQHNMRKIGTAIERTKLVLAFKWMASKTIWTILKPIDSLQARRIALTMLKKELKEERGTELQCLTVRHLAIVLRQESGVILFGKMIQTNNPEIYHCKFKSAQVKPRFQRLRKSTLELHQLLLIPTMLTHLSNTQSDSSTTTAKFTNCQTCVNLTTLRKQRARLKTMLPSLKTWNVISKTQRCLTRSPLSSSKIDQPTMTTMPILMVTTKKAKALHSDTDHRLTRRNNKSRRSHIRRQSLAKTCLVQLNRISIAVKMHAQQLDSVSLPRDLLNRVKRVTREVL